MKCDICNKNEGQIFLECMTNKGKMKINLCTQCAASRGIAAPTINPDKKNIGAIFEEVRQIKMQIDPDFSQAASSFRFLKCEKPGTDRRSKCESIYVLLSL